MKSMRLMMATAAAGLVLAGTAAFAAEFSDTQKGEIEGIIKEYLMKNPEIIRDAMQELERRQAEQEAQAQLSAIKDNADAIYRAEHDLVGGNPEGNISVVEFFDYNCGYCKKAFKDVMTMIENDKDVRLVMKEFPILGPGSVYAAKAALASREQGKYWELHMALLEHNGRIDEAVVDKVAEATGLDLAKLRKDMEDPKVMAALQANMQLAEALRINGTPAFIIDQTLIPGAVGYDSLAAVINDVRKAGGCKIC